MTLSVGETLRWASPGTGFAQWNRFAAVNDEFVPIHMDDEEGRRAGYPAAIAMGRLLWSYVHRMLRERLPEGGRIVSVSMQFRAPAVRDVAFTVSATVTQLRESDAELYADLELSVHDADGSVLAPGTATVAWPGQR